MSDLWSIISLGIIVLILLLAFFSLHKIIKTKKEGFPANDERTAQINGRAAIISLQIGSFSIIAFLFFRIFMREFYNITIVEVEYPLIAVLLIYNISFIVLNWHFSRTT